MTTYLEECNECHKLFEEGDSYRFRYGRYCSEECVKNSIKVPLWNKLMSSIFKKKRGKK